MGSFKKITTDTKYFLCATALSSQPWTYEQRIWQSTCPQEVSSLKGKADAET